VITLLNIHKPRDRSHYERFEAYHETFYRSVEATSVTPLHHVPSTEGSPPSWSHWRGMERPA